MRRLQDLPGDAFPTMAARKQSDPQYLGRLYAVLIREGDDEGMVRRETPYGAQPLVTSDPDLARRLLAVAQRYYPEAFLAEFGRDG